MREYKCHLEWNIGCIRTEEILNSHAKEGWELHSMHVTHCHEDDNTAFRFVFSKFATWNPSEPECRHHK